MNYLSDMRRRYQQRDLPWDDPLPPPEIIAAAAQLPPGRMLDLGCGGGRACIYLAQRGWCCTGIDIVPEAITLAEERADAAGVSAQIYFHVGSVADLDLRLAPYDLAIDVGCLHSLNDDQARRYADGLARLLRPGAHYLLFGRTEQPGIADGLRGLTEPRVRALFAPNLRIDTAVFGMTENAQSDAVPSAWFWLSRC
ncbi:MAG: class I SAM-dependent methyltransferase [Oscillochloris sp.]|nr:class I SAM-dependent methyltransferase [Oscillochloris sp.]